jgi:O-antigen/teichoic acid export membrane protein
MWRDWSRRFLWLSLGSLIGRLLPYAMLIWLGRHLDSPAFATVGVAFAWTAVSASLTTGGLANVAAQRLAGIENPGEARAMVRRIALIGVALSGLLVAIVLVIGTDTVVGLFGQSIDARAVAPALLSGATWSLVMLAVAAFNGMHAARQAASVLSLGGALQGAGLALGLWAGGGQLDDILWGFAGGNACALAFALWRLSSLPPLREGRNEAPPSAPTMPLGSAVAWATLATACVTPVTFAAGAIISHGPDGALQLARFHALEQLHQLATYFPSVMAVAMLPVLSRRTMKDGGVSVRSAVKVSWLMAGVGSALALVLAWNPTWLHQLVGNPALNDPAATRGMLMHVALYPSLSILGSAVLARGQFAPATLLNMAWAAVLLGVTWLWREDGAAAVQAARLVASGLLLVVLSVLLWIAGGTPLPARNLPGSESS